MPLDLDIVQSECQKILTLIQDLKTAPHGTVYGEDHCTHLRNVVAALHEYVEAHPC